MLTLFGAGAVTMMLIAYSLESRAVAWVLVFALACAASSAYGWFAGTWPFGVVEGIWAIVAARRWFIRKARGCEPVPRTDGLGPNSPKIMPESWLLGWPRTR